jgi:hypothetical protein
MEFTNLLAAIEKLDDEQIAVVESALRQARLNARSRREATNRSELKLGDRVMLVDIRPAHYTGQTGTIIGKAKTKFEVVVDLYNTRIRVPAVCMTRIPRRPESHIMREVSGVYSQLSPENLSADGERTPQQVARLRADLQGKLDALFAELGRKVSEAEAFANTSAVA